ncbi:SulP family inorganic anion transporter [Halioxenophilus aromaticivorans]|uniref:SulP family inorganic anion transporter n=1 Tax=Halioxenophilus aromaticivorans TaxID=1306992 RepID=A0AAV3U4E5_9ALTE
MKSDSLFKDIKYDLPASVVVFFVALPLCLGIALASGAPLFSGIIAGIVGGIVVGAASGSKLGVSGPAAGLAVIVFDAITNLGGWEVFLCAVVLAGVIQITLGYAKAGFIAYFFPTSVITGMLTGIGLIIILKQLPYLLGWHADFIGEQSFSQANGENTLTAIQHAISVISIPAVILSAVSLALLVAWDKFLVPCHKIFELIQGPIVVVLLGIVVSALMASNGVGFDSEQLVTLPEISSFAELTQEMAFPAFSQMFSWDVLTVAVVLAAVASIETLLSVEATDKLDPNRGVTPTNRELKAQGLGNIVSGLVGGLPVTQVIVRSSANIAFGARSKLSGIVHGFLLLISVATIASLLNYIPLSSLAAVLIIVGYKLAKPAMFAKMFKYGPEQFFPFIVTIVAMLATDLLTGVVAGLVVSIFFSLKHSYENSFKLKETAANEEPDGTRHIVLAEEVTFFNKPSIMRELNDIPQDTNVILDFSNTRSVAHDVAETVKEFVTNAPRKNIKVQTINFNPAQVA